MPAATRTPLARREGGGGLRPVGERAAVSQLHHIVRSSARTARPHLLHHHDATAAFHRLQQPDFAEQFLPVGVAGGEELDRHPLAGEPVFGLPHGAERPGAELLDERVAVGRVVATGGLTPLNLAGQRADLLARTRHTRRRRGRRNRAGGNAGPAVDPRRRAVLLERTAAKRHFVRLDRRIAGRAGGGRRVAPRVVRGFPFGGHCEPGERSGCKYSTQSNNVRGRQATA